MAKITPKLLLFKYYTDPWSSFILRRKYKNRIMLRIMERFENSIRIILLRKIRRTEMHYQKRKIKKKNIRNFIFRILFKFYGIQRTFNQSTNSLLNYWKKTHIRRSKKKIAPRFFRMNYLYFYAVEKRLPYIKPRLYFIQRKLDFKKFRLYYCFSSNQKFKYYLKKVEYNFIKTPLQFGISSLLVEFIFKTNIFPTTRFSYNFIKIGGVLVNNFCVKNPHKSLKVFDLIRVNPIFIRLVFNYFRLRLKKKKGPIEFIKLCWF